MIILMGKETFRYLNVTLYAWALALSTDIKIGNLAYFVSPPPGPPQGM
jgi:hypothetical protein